MAARIISWIFGLYGLLVLAMALATDRIAENVMLYGRPFDSVVAAEASDATKEAVSDLSLRTRDLKRVTVDTTVQPKAITFWIIRKLVVEISVILLASVPLILQSVLVR